ncbi:CWC16 protein [Xylaria curta]|nr:CWC16 protein [Xylaria curta]
MQGFNMGRYVPPDVEGTISGNALNKKHALGARASKLRTEGILTVRFEMPFGVWCGTCSKPTIIGQGVRFNAEKKRVGSYHSTPIWSFRMRHTECGGVIEIRTDPASAEYVVTEGGTRRDTGDDKDDSLVTSRHLIGGLGEIQTAKEKDALRNDAFARLEKTIEDRGVLVERTHRIAELEDASYRAWEDPYTQNRRLRAAFRTGRKAREKDAASNEDLKERMSLGIDLVPATEEDARRAALVDFGVVAALHTTPDMNDDEEDVARRKARIKDAALTKPLFATAPVVGSTNGLSKTTTDGTGEGSSNKKKRLLKTEIKASQTRESLAETVTRNTRVSQDPFLVGGGGGGDGGSGTSSKSSTRIQIQGIKRKRADAESIPLSMVATTSSLLHTHPPKEEDIEVEGRIKGGMESSGPDVLEAGKSLDMTDSPLKTVLALVEYDSD